MQEQNKADIRYNTLAWFLGIHVKFAAHYSHVRVIIEKFQGAVHRNYQYRGAVPVDRQQLSVPDTLWRSIENHLPWWLFLCRTTRGHCDQKYKHFFQHFPLLLCGPQDAGAG